MTLTRFITVLAVMLFISPAANAWRIEKNILIIEKGDNLSAISHSLFGRGTAYERLWKKCMDSLQSKDPNMIYDGMRFNLDSILGQAPDAKSAAVVNHYYVLPGKQSDGTLDASAWAAIVSALLALAAIVATLALNSKSVRNSARVEHNSFFQEIDKQLVEDPYLWTVYNNPEVTGGLLRPNTPLHKMKRKAFLFMHMNSYDSIYYFYHKIILRKKTDKSTLETWSEYYRYLYQHSDEFREVVHIAITKRYYQQDFINYLKKEFGIL